MYIQSHTLSRIHFQASPAHFAQCSILKKYTHTQCFRDVRHFNKNDAGIPKVFHLGNFSADGVGFPSHFPTLPTPALLFSCLARRVCRYSNCYEYRLPNYANNDPRYSISKGNWWRKGENDPEKKTIKFIRSLVFQYISFSSSRYTRIFFPRFSSCLVTLIVLFCDVNTLLVSFGRILRGTPVNRRRTALAREICLVYPHIPSQEKKDTERSVFRIRNTFFICFFIRVRFLSPFRI